MDPFRALMAASISSSVSRPVLVTLLCCTRESGSAVDMEELYEHYTHVHERLWNKKTLETYSSFHYTLSSRFRVKRKSLQDFSLDANRELVCVRVGGRGPFLVPTKCVLGEEDLIPCPPEWGMVEQHVGIFDKGPKLFITENLPPPLALGMDWNVKEPLLDVKIQKDPLPKKDVGYIYIMIDTQRESRFVKLGMTRVTPQDRLVSLRTGNPYLMLGMSVLVYQPREVEARVHAGVVDLADRVTTQGSTEFFALREKTTLFDLTERVLKLTFAHRLDTKTLVRELG